MLNAFGRGLLSNAIGKSKALKWAINGGLLLLYGAILFIYSYLVWDLDNESKLGIACSIAVVINDLYIYMMFNARIINRISILALIIFCSRFFIMLGGSEYWFYGYMFTYVWLESAIVLGIVEKRLPYNSEIEITQVDKSQLQTKKTKFLDLARVPEFIFCVITIGLIVSTVIADSLDLRGV